MAVFRFNLQTVHSLKRQIEDQAKNNLAMAIVEMTRETEELLAIHRNIDMTLDEFRTLSGAVFSAWTIRDYNNFIAVLKEKAKAQQKVVDAAKRRVSDLRRELLTAVQQREMFDKLYERAYEQHIEDEKHAEQLATDDLISYRGNPN